MKFSIPKTELQRGLSRLQSLVEKRSTMPILANVLLVAGKQKKDGWLQLAATDLEVGMRSRHPCDVAEPGEVTISAKKLYEIIRELPDESLKIESSPNSYLTLDCARTHFTLAGNAAEEYPTLPDVALGQMVPIQAVVLSDMIARTMYAASIDETRYNLNGVYLEQQPDAGKLRMVATDGHRLAYVDRLLVSQLQGVEKGVILPRKGLAELKRLADEGDADEIEVGLLSNNAVARKGDVTLLMRLIEGEFPNYHQVIPRDVSHHVVISAEALTRAVRRVALLSAEHSKVVKLEFSTGLLRLSSSNPDLGEASEELDLDYAGEDLAIAFSARYLVEALGAVAGKEVQLGLRDPLSPCQLVPTDDADTLAVIMPIRI
jgi:DNA polymerase-3 subunit beta